MDEEHLISLVSKYPELYDLQNVNYMNSTRKNNIWQEISKELGVKDTICKDKWKGLRDGFHRNVKKNKTKSDKTNQPKIKPTAKKTKKWKFEKQMQFLLPFLHERATRTNFEDTASYTSEDTSPKYESVTSPLSATSAESMNKTITARKKNLTQKQNPSVAEVLNNYLDRSTTKLASQPDNPINSFFKAMADTVITLPPDLQLKAKNKIFAIVSEIEYENFQRKTNPSDVDREFKEQRFNPGSSTSTQGPPSKNFSYKFEEQRFNPGPSTSTHGPPPKKVSCKLEEQRFNPGPSTSTHGPPLNNPNQKLQTDSENIDFDCPDNTFHSDTYLGEINDDVSQSILHDTATKYILTYDGRLLRRQ